MREKIINYLKSNALSLDLLIELLESDEETVKNELDNLIKEGKVKYSPGIQLYKLITKRSTKNISNEELCDLIVEYINSKDNEYFYAKEIVKRFNINFKRLDNVLNKLKSERKIYKIPHEDAYSLLFEGIISINPRGYGFIKSNDIEYFVEEDQLNNIYNNDKVLFAVKPNYDGGKLANAHIIKVIERGNEFIIGKLVIKEKSNGRISCTIFSTMKSLRICKDVYDKSYEGIDNGSIVRAKIDYNNNCASIVEVLGHVDDPGIDITQIALEYGFNLEFPDEVLEEIKEIPDIVDSSKYQNRRDFRNLSIITIDGDDSKDYDDAVYVKKYDDHYELQVHIADVSEYVKDNHPLDKEALKRGTSVYLADRVIPMLPRKLSNGICSLNEGVDRLVLSCIMQIDFKGRLISYDICEGIINSHHRMTYNNVNKMINNDQEIIDKYNDIYPMILDMLELSNILRNIRVKKGALEFDSPEYKISLDSNGVPINIVKRERYEAEKLIEDFMLKANETVAYHMAISNLPCVYRVHEKPDQEKLHEILRICRKLNSNLYEIKKDIKPFDLQNLLKIANEGDNSLIINSMLLRGMMKAKYSNECEGHYGLAMYYYCHFTSPIRRYPDLITHRIIKDLCINNKNYESKIDYYNNILYDIAVKNSKSERNSIECEREVDSMLYCKYLDNSLIKTFKGTITSITQYGMYVTLENGIEGLVAYRNCYDYIDFDEVNLRAYSPRKTYNLGDIVKVRIYEIDHVNHKIDFALTV